MKDLREAFAEFWGGFYDRRQDLPCPSPIPAFMRGYAVFRGPEGKITKNPVFPYITYELARPSFGEFTVCTAQIWDRNTDNPGFTGLVDDVLAQIAEKLPEEGVLLEAENGFVKLSRANPFMDYMNDPDIKVVRGVVRYGLRGFLY